MTNTAIRYTPELKQTLIDLHEKGHSFKELHEEYGPSLDTIRKCVQAATGLKSIFETDFKRHSEPRLPSTAQINH